MGETMALIYLFQSAPLTEARGDAGKSSVLDSIFWFQSAPLTEARGDLQNYEVDLI